MCGGDGCIFADGGTDAGAMVSQSKHADFGKSACFD